MMVYIFGDTAEQRRPPVLILVAFLIFAGAISIINPLFESTDETRHYRYIRHIVVERRLPVQGEEEARSQSHHPPLYYVLSALFSGVIPSPHTPEYRQPMNPFWGYRNWEVGIDNKLQYWHSPAESFPYREGYLGAMIPRWLNVIIGAVAVVLTYQLGRCVWPEHPGLAGAAAALLAFNPQFVYLSAAMNNDIMATATSALVLLICLKLIQSGATQRYLVILGIAYGLALLTKLHLASLGAVIALALWLESKAYTSFRARIRHWMRGMLVVLIIAMALSGWWFVRNWRLYGDPTGMSKVNELWAGRSAQDNWWAVQQGLHYLWSSFWGRFGYGQIPLPQPVYTLLSILCSVSLLAYVLPKRTKSGSALLLSTVTVILFVGIVLYYMLIQPAGPMGRFLFPALPAFALVFVEGWERWLRCPQCTAVGVALGMAVLCLFALGVYLWPAVRYPPQAPLATYAREPLDVQVGDLARVLSAEVHPTTVQPGESVFVSVTWSPLHWSTVPYVVYVHLVDEAGVVIAQRDTWPGLGRAPTTSWRAEYPFMDTYYIELPDAIYAPNCVSVRVGLYESNLGRLPVYESGDPGPLVDGYEVGTLRIEPLSGPWPNAMHANFGNEIALIGYSLEPRVLSAGETLTATLYWKPLRQPKRYYGVFAQVIDPSYQVWGSHDGAGPAWIFGNVITETRRITLLPETPSGSYPVQVGLSHEDTGRLRVIAPDGQYLDKRVLLGPIRVQD